MKHTSCSLAVCLLISTSLTALAIDKAPGTKKTGHPANPQPTQKVPNKKPTLHDVVVVTGSHLNRDADHKGYASDGPALVYVLDANTIGNSGAATVRELLTRKGVGR